MRLVAWWVILGGFVLACGGESRSIGVAGDGSQAGSNGAGPPRGAELGNVDPGFGAGGVPPIGVVAGAPSQTGAAGLGVTGSNGGGSGGDVCVFPPAQSELSDWSNIERTPQEALDAVVQNMPGDWFGIVTTPWVDPYDVVLTFSPDGHYRGRCAVSSNQCCEAFYYGTDDDCVEKRYSVEDATLSGNVTGTIDIGFGIGENECSLPAWQGELSFMAVDATLDRLRFDFSTSDGYGPLHFELQRVPRPHFR